MNYSKRKILPLGSVLAEGFLREQLLRSKNGMGGHLPEIEPGMIKYPYIKKVPVKRWAPDCQSGWGAEISGNYYAGLVGLAFTLGDSELIAAATEWVDAVLKNIRPDGYLGTYDGADESMNADYNAWGTASGMRALLSFYEATGREDVFGAVYSCMLWFCKNWAGEKKTSYAGQYIIEPMIRCYHKTGDRRLLDFCVDYEDFLVKNTPFDNSYRHFLDPKLNYNANHTAAYGINVRMPAWIYSATGDEAFLNSTRVGINKLRAKAVQLSGGPVSMSEYVGPVSSVAETEYCSFTFFNSTYSLMHEITGEGVYGDMAEEIVYNGAEGARKKDERAIAYLSAPNQVFATDLSSPAMGDMQVYSPCYPVACCPVNSVALIPDFVRSMAMTDSSGNLYISLYGPCSIKYGNWNVKLNTGYPFRDKITVNIASRGGERIFLRIPAWCKKHTVLCDGAEYSAVPSADGYFSVAGDVKTVELTLFPEVEVLHVDDSDAAGKHPLAFRRGALLYSLPIEERWEPYYPETETPLAPEWPWFRVTPVYKEADCADSHERLGKNKENYTWNVAVDENISASEITFSEVETNGAYPWEAPPVTLSVPAYKAPYAVAPYPQKTFEPFGAKLSVSRKLTLTLVPYGATNLRISYFPRADV